MFGKTAKKTETIIGADSVFKGELQVKGTVRIDGILEGDISADWIVVGESGKIVGNVKSRGTVIGGGVEGNIEADEIAELKHKSCVSGEIKAGKLAISEGASFTGRITMEDGRESAASPDAKIIKLNSTSTTS